MLTKYVRHEPRDMTRDYIGVLIEPNKPSTILFRFGSIDSLLHFQIWLELENFLRRIVQAWLEFEVLCL